MPSRYLTIVELDYGDRSNVRLRQRARIRIRAATGYESHTYIPGVRGNRVVLVSCLTSTATAAYYHLSAELNGKDEMFLAARPWNGIYIVGYPIVSLCLSLMSLSSDILHD